MKRKEFVRLTLKGQKPVWAIKLRTLKTGALVFIRVTEQGGYPWKGNTEIRNYILGYPNEIKEQPARLYRGELEIIL